MLAQWPLEPPPTLLYYGVYSTRVRMELWKSIEDALDSVATSTQVWFGASRTVFSSGESPNLGLVGRCRVPPPRLGQWGVVALRAVRCAPRVVWVSPSHSLFFPRPFAVRLLLLGGHGDSPNAIGWGALRPQLVGCLTLLSQPFRPPCSPGRPMVLPVPRAGEQWPPDCASWRGTGGVRWLFVRTAVSPWCRGELRLVEWGCVSPLLWRPPVLPAPAADHSLRVEAAQ